MVADRMLPSNPIGLQGCMRLRMRPGNSFIDCGLWLWKFTARANSQEGDAV